MALSLADRLKQHVKVASEYKDAKPSEILDVDVLDIRPTSKVRSINGVDMRVMQVITKEHGSFFPLEEAIANPVSNFGDGVKAKLSIRANDYKNAAGEVVEGINCTRVVLQTLTASQEAGIRAAKGSVIQFAL